MKAACCKPEVTREEKEERRDSSCPSSHDEVRRSFLCRTKSIRPVARLLFLSPYPWGPLELLSPSSSVRYCKEKQSSGKKKRMKYEWIAFENQYTSNNSKESLNWPPESCLKRVLYGPLIHSHLFLYFFFLEWRYSCCASEGKRLAM